MTETQTFRGDWLDTIPEDWSQRKIKHLFTIKKNISGELGHDVISITQRGAKIKDVDSGRGQVSMDYSKYQFVNTGDFLMNHMDLLTGYVDISQFDGVTSPDYRVFELKDQSCFPKYHLYLFQHCYKSRIFYGYGRGSSHLGRWRFPTVEFEDFYLPLPPYGTQELISRYLDTKTEQLDSLIERVQTKIDLLKEQRTSLINQCVTKGLDPNVEMKDSGVEWIGEIPSHWDIKRLAIIGRFTKGKNITKGDLVEDGEPVILYSHLYTTYDRETSHIEFFISEEKSEESTKIKPDTFLFTSSGESREDIGKTLLYRGNNQVNIGGDMVVFNLKDPNTHDLTFLSFIFNSKSCQDQKSSSSRGDIVVHIYEKQLREVLICIPPKDEQELIGDFLVSQDELTSKLISYHQDKVTLLIEYRQSLISSVVTGKVRVTEDMV